MHVAWIARDEKGVVTAFCDVAFADRQTLEDFASSGRKVDLVKAESITLNKRLSLAAIILKSGID